MHRLDKGQQLLQTQPLHDGVAASPSGPAPSPGLSVGLGVGFFWKKLVSGLMPLVLAFLSCRTPLLSTGLRFLLSPAVLPDMLPDEPLRRIPNVAEEVEGSEPREEEEDAALRAGVGIPGR